MPEMHLKQLGFTSSALPKTNKEFTNLKKQEMQNAFIQSN